ncbi:MAG: right-handed parallel beta-helix repeat-containing protein [Anaerolineae bacterium]|nr:right-handed parallel beta-helix repeat-containing protein [Anaerolineae bacterium]
MTPTPSTTPTGQPMGRYENDAAGAFTYHGSWYRYAHASASAGSVHQGDKAGDIAGIVLYGTQPTGANTVEIGYTRNLWGGIFEVYVDGQLKATVDTYGPLQWRTTVLITPVGTFAPHRIEIVNTGQKSPYSLGTYIMLDWVELKMYQAPAPTATKIPWDSDSRLEDTSPRWDYYGAWTEWAVSGTSGGSVRYTRAYDDSAGVIVRINQVPGMLEIGYYQATWAGIFEVYIDNNLVATVDGHGPREFQKTYQIYGLSTGNHFIRLRNTGEKNASATDTYFALDWIRIENAYRTATPTFTPTAVSAADRFEDTSSAWTWGGGDWYIYSNTNASGGSVKWSTAPGSTATFRVANVDQVEFGYTQQSFMGIFEVWLDGEVYAVVDAYGPTVWQKEVTVSGIGSGIHEIKIRNTGARNAASTGNYVYVDYMDVIPVYHTPTPTSTPFPALNPGTYQDNNLTAWKYGGAWVQHACTPCSGGTGHYSNEVGATAGITFTGTGGNAAEAFEVGYTKAMWGGIVEVYANGELIDSFDTYNSTVVQQVTRTIALPDSPTAVHTVYFKVTGQKNVVANDANFYLDWLRVIPTFTPTDTPEPVYYGIGRYETEDDAIALSQSWIAYNNTSFSAGMAHYTNWSGATATLAFHGLWVEIGFFTGRSYSMFDIYIDGAFIHRVDAYAPGTTQPASYVARAPHDGNHILEVRTASEKNPLALNTLTMLDYFQVLNVVPTETPTVTPAPTQSPQCRASVSSGELPGSVLSDPNGVFVNCGYTGASTGTFSQPYHTIAEALDAATEGKHVYVLPGTYNIDIGEFTVGAQVGSLTFSANNVHLISTHGRTETVIDADGMAAPVFEVSIFANLVIDGFRIVRGASDYATVGGGVFVHDSATVRITNNEFWGNVGGAIGVTESASASIEGNLIHHNSNFQSSDATIILNNTRGDGYVRNNRIYDNMQAAIRVENDNTLIARNFIYGNTAPSGAVSAIDARQFAASRIENNVIYRNTSSGAGSATVALGDDQAILVNNTIANNHDESTVLVNSAGFAVVLNNAITHNTGTGLVNCLYATEVFANNVWGNGGNYGPGCDLYAAGEDNNISTNPFYYDMANDDFHIHVYPQGMSNKGVAQTVDGVLAAVNDSDAPWAGEDGSLLLGRDIPTNLGDPRNAFPPPDIGADEVAYDPIDPTPTDTPTPTDAPAPEGAPPGVYQEDYEDINYTGEWVTYTDPNAMDGAAAWTRENGGRFDFQFAGSRVELFLAECRSCGTAEIWLDGQLLDTIDTYIDATATYEWSYNILTDYGSHNVRVVSTSTRWLGLDAIEVAIADPITDGKHENNEPYAFYFTDDWTFYSPAQGSGTVQFSTNAKARAWVLFTGHGFSLEYFAMGPWGGRFEIWVDDVMYQTVDTYATAVTFGHAVEITGLTGGDHVLEIRHAGKNSAATDQYIMIDYINIMP